MWKWVNFPFELSDVDLNAIISLREALQKPLPGIVAQELMAARAVLRPESIPAHARPSAVLALLYPQDDSLGLVLIRRTEDGRAHSGQISFPGGKQEPSDADLRATALRETQEEVGVLSLAVQIIGELTQLYIPVSNFQVFPFVGFSEHRPMYRINTHEVDEIIEVPVAHLFHPDRKVVARINPSSNPTLILKAPAYKLADNQIIWGATAMILSELEAIFNRLSS